MTCAFDVEHYRELIEAARGGGYRFAFFDHDPQPADLFLRHDVDLSLATAAELAELEHELGADVNVLPMTKACSQPGLVGGGDGVPPARPRHRVGSTPSAAGGLDERFDPVMPSTTEAGVHE